MSEGDIDFGTPFNVIAAFPRESDGAAAVEALAGWGVPRSALTVHQPNDGRTGELVSELEAEMQDELVSGWGALSDRQAKEAFGAALRLGVVGVVLGVLAGLGWSYLVASGLNHLDRVAIVATVTGLAGATIGFVDGGGGLNWRRGREQNTDDLPVTAERDVLVAVHAGDPHVAEQAATLLRQLGAERVHLVDTHGIPLPPQAQHPRPADPEGWWWRNAGHG